MFNRIFRLFIGAPRDITSKDTYHAIGLVAVLAWVGLGADGLSSSAYGPDEAYRALGDHYYLAIFLALATTITVIIISLAYSNIIECFPFGGGGYGVSTKLLGPRFGLLSGSALLVDYVLTVTVSIASCTDQLFSLAPLEWHSYKLPVAAFIIAVMVLMNLRGAKESILVLTPIFVLFLVTHAFLIFGGIFSHLGDVGTVTGEIKTDFQEGLHVLGVMGMVALFFRAFSMGAGTFTGIEAVSNGLQIMREPRVRTGKRTMFLMAASLAITASGILICYLLFRVHPVEGKTMNAALLEAFAGHYVLFGLPLGQVFIIATLFSEAALLFVAAQAGFIGGPRMLANMSHDSWIPHRFSQVSDRLTLQYGILLISVAALAALFYTGGNITTLVTMYSINVFLTFSLSMAGMCKHWLTQRKNGIAWRRPFAIQVTSFVLCFTILIVVIIEKFQKGAWVTLLVTAILVTLCWLINRHYKSVQEGIRKLSEIFEGLHLSEKVNTKELNPHEPTAVLLVGGYNGLGIHQLLQVQRMFPNYYHNVIFVSVGVVDSATMNGLAEVEHIRDRTETSLRQYVDMAQRLGWAADYRVGMGTEAVEESLKLCTALTKDYPKSVFFLGKLIFETERWYQRVLHNETSYQMQRRMHFLGLTAIILTVRMMDSGGAKHLKKIVRKAERQK